MRRALPALLGVAAASLVVGLCSVVALGLDTGFRRAADRADLPDVIARFRPLRQSEVDERLRALPNVAARAYRFEVTRVGLRFGARHVTDRGVVHSLASLRARRGYKVIAGHDLRPDRDDEVLVEQGLRRAWGVQVGDHLHVGELGTLRVVGIVLSPDNVAFPLASAPRVYVGPDEVHRRFGPGELPVGVALLWTHDRSRLDVTLAQARASSFGLVGLRVLTRGGIALLVHQAAGIVIALLVAFSLVALVASGVMLGTAAHADVQRHLPGLAVRRALGFSRGRVVRDAARRAVLVALPGAMLGLTAGWLLARSPTDRLLGLLNEQPPGTAVLPLLAICLAGIVALVVAASTWPTWRATARSPSDLLRGGELAPRTRRKPKDGLTLFRFAPFTLGARLVAARRGRFAGTVAVLAACAGVVLLMLGLATALARLRDDPATLGKRYSLSVTADRALQPDIERVDGVAAAAPRWTLPAADTFDLGEQLKVIIFPGDHATFEAPPLAEGRRLRGDGEAEVGVGAADALGLRVGGTVGLALGTGQEVRLRVVGIVRALDQDGRVVYARPRRFAAALEGVQPPIVVRVDSDARRSDVSTRLAAAGFDTRSVGGAVPRDGTLLRVLSTVLRVVAGAVGLVLLYALAQALALTAAERRPTLGLLRTLGAGPGTLALVLSGAGLALVVPAVALAAVLAQTVLAPLVQHLAAGYADLPVTASVGQVGLVAAGLAALAILAASGVAMRTVRRPLVEALREA